MLVETKVARFNRLLERTKARDHACAQPPDFAAHLSPKAGHLLTQHDELTVHGVETLAKAPVHRPKQSPHIMQCRLLVPHRALPSLAPSYRWSTQPPLLGRTRAGLR